MSIFEEHLVSGETAYKTASGQWIERIRIALYHLRSLHHPLTRDVHILQPASLISQTFRRWELITFSSEIGPQILADQQPGWIIPRVVAAPQTSVSKEKASLLILTDGRAASGQTYPLAWKETALGHLAIPEKNLYPLEEVPAEISLRTTYQTLREYINFAPPHTQR